MARTPLSTQDLERIRELHAAGESCNAIAKALGRSPSTISARCKGMGLEFNADRTAPATENRIAANRSKRARLEERFLDEAANLLDELHKPHLVFSFGGRDNEYAEHLHDSPDVSAKRQLIQAAGTAVDKALRLADADKAGNGADAGKSMIGSLFAALATYPIQDTPEEPADDA